MKHSAKLLPALLGAALTLFSPNQAQAAVIVANTALQSGAFASGQSSGLLAAGFLSPTVATSLTSVSAALEPTAGTVSVSLSLYTESSGNPGTLIGLLASQNVTVGQSVQTFTPASAIALAAATNYFLVMSCGNCAAPPNNNWSGSGVPTLAGMTGADLLSGVRSSTNGGATWNNFTGRSAIFTVNGDVESSGVPEPSTFALTLGAAALLYFKRRR